MAPIELPQGLSGLGGSVVLRHRLGAAPAPTGTMPSLLATLAGLAAIPARRQRAAEVAPPVPVAASAADPVSLADTLRDLRSRQAARAVAGQEIAA